MFGPFRHRRLPVACPLIVTAMLLLPACAPSALEGTFNSPDPAAKLNAIRRAGIERDRSAIPRLIEQLDSDDPSVRMFAIGALDRITGTRLGYNYYDPPAERRAAVDRWVRAYHEHRFDPAAQPAAHAAAPPEPSAPTAP